MTDFDTLDLQIIHALRLDGRVSFSAVADVLEVSDQTVARRYKRMRGEGLLRVVGLPDPVRLGHSTWLLRLQATPDAAGAVATALARRPDTTWVSLSSGGTEIVGIVQTSRDADRDDLLLHKLPRTPRIVSVGAHLLLRRFAGGPIGAAVLPNVLTPAQQAPLRFTVDPATPAAPLEPSDDALLALLAKDGRASLADLASGTGWSEPVTRRRLALLRSSGAVYFDLEADPVLLGYGVRMMLWLTVEPAHLDEVGNALATHPEVVFAAATTGPTNVVASAVFPDTSAVYDYLVRRIGPLPGVREVQTAPSIRTVKQVGTLELRG